MEALLHKPIPVLDHGFVRVVDYMGDDAAVVQAARVSYGKGTKKRTDDRGLVRYLMRHRHTTPFEMLELKLHIKLPIFVARQWVRHRTANINEYSARYSILDDEFYVPESDQLALQSQNNRQGRGQTITGARADKIIDVLRGDAARAYKSYLWMLNGSDDQSAQVGAGLARELARINLPLNTYTQWYWKIDLHNLLRFLELRTAQNAQYEIRAYRFGRSSVSRKRTSWIKRARACGQRFLDRDKNSPDGFDDQF